MRTPPRPLHLHHVERPVGRAQPPHDPSAPSNLLDTLINQIPRWEQASAISTILLIVALR